MLERLLAQTTSSTFEPSLATVCLRFIGLSGFLFIICFFVCAYLKGPSDFETYQWAVPLGIWICGTVLLFIGAYRAFANSPVKDTSMTAIKISQGVTLAYLGFAAFIVSRGGDGVALMIASVIELFFGSVTIAFVLIAALTRTPLTRAIWFAVFLTLCAAYLTIKQLANLFQAFL